MTSVFRYLIGFTTLALMSMCTTADHHTSFNSTWSGTTINRPWAGPEYWANPLQAWQQREGKLNCVISGGDRNLVVLTREMSGDMTDFTMSVEVSKPISETEPGIDSTGSQGWVGFKVGLKGIFGDYRDDALKGRGLSIGVSRNGQIFVGNASNSKELGYGLSERFRVSLTGKANIEKDNYELTVSYQDLINDAIENFTSTVDNSWLQGLVALTCSHFMPGDSLSWADTRPPYNQLNEPEKEVGGSARFGFRHLQLAGDKFAVKNERSFGPIMWTQYTLSDSLLKMSVQMAPIGSDNPELTLVLDDRSLVAEIDRVGRNAVFRIAGLDPKSDHPYQVVYRSVDGNSYVLDGVVRGESDRRTIKIASLSCVDDRGFPHQELVDNVKSHHPDLLTFHGDQLYERVGGFGVERSSILDYLRKWYVFGWSFGDLLSNIPAVIIPDDHDVFHGNLWGEGGKAADTSLGFGYDSQDSGGYKEPPEFVNMVHRTQTGHLPDPADPVPVEQNISVYFTTLNYGGLSIAILGDRQWKSAPKPLFPDAEIENGWPQNRRWNAARQAFHPSAQLLGPRQERFLEDWVLQWPKGVVFKAVVSQSPFCNVATLPADIYHDKFVPGLPRYKVGEYPPDDRPVADFDSNGWPQNKRDKAIEIIRKSFSLHLTGDQHLGSTGQYGIDEYGDGGYWISSPAVSNLWPRRWFPAADADGGKAPNDKRRYTGNYLDGFGNKMTIKGVANPYDVDQEPGFVYDKAPGYSIITFDKTDRTIGLEVWPRWSGLGPNSLANDPFPDWPIEIHQLENYGREVKGHLPPIEIEGKEVVKLVNQETEELIYILRPPIGQFRPAVFDLTLTYAIEIMVDSQVEILTDLKAQKME